MILPLFSPEPCRQYVDSLGAFRQMVCDPRRARVQRINRLEGTTKVVR